VGVALCAIVILLPNAGFLLPAKLAVATYGTLVLPGAVILRLLGWPRSPAAALPACAAWSLAALAPGLVLMLLSDGGLQVAVLWLLLVIGVGLLAGRGRPVEMDIGTAALALWVAGGLVTFGVLVWLGSWNNVGDAVEHIARMRKLSELDPPRSLDELGLLPPNTGLHPGYAFPLWHAAGAVVVWISSLEETVMFRYWPAMLLPFSAAAVYSAGRTMFGARAAGAATCLAYLALFAFPNEGVGYFNRLSYPGYICILVFWPLVIERTFAYLRNGGWEPLLTIAATSLIVTAVHGSYAPFMVMLIVAFLVARTIVTRDRDDLRRLVTVVGALAVPFFLFLIWLYPIADAAASTVANASLHFKSLVDRSDGLVNMKPEWLTRGGAATVAALLLVPVASAATRTRAAAFIAGGFALGILTLIVPYFFTPFADIVSISQGRRFIFFLPWAFALTAGALVLARFRYVAVAVALAAGVFLQWAWPGDFNYILIRPGPAWVAWFAAAGALVALGLGAARKLRLPYGNGWAVPILVAFVLPIAVDGLGDLKLNRPASAAYGKGFLTAVRKDVDRDDVLLARPRVAYRLSAQAPIYIVAAFGGHGGETVVNQHAERRTDANAFFGPDKTTQELSAILERWDVDWVLVKKDDTYPREFLSQFTPTFENNSFILYPVSPDAG
jgi:hypothetical protein